MSCVLAFREISPQNHLKIVELLSIALGNLDAAATRAKLSGGAASSPSSLRSLALLHLAAAARARGVGGARARKMRTPAPLPRCSQVPTPLPSSFHQGASINDVWACIGVVVPARVPKCLKRAGILPLHSEIRGKLDFTRFHSYQDWYE